MRSNATSVPDDTPGPTPTDQLGAHEPDWGCSWEATRLRQLTAGLAVTPAERLAWLEEAIDLAAACGALPRPRG
jgi:hypothetical protein